MSAGHDMACGTCGRTWNSEETPTPAARCPYEYEHAEETGWNVTLVIDGTRLNFVLPESERYTSEDAVTDYILEFTEVFVSRI